ncbi:hypothetical protein NHQ30_009087 [Ciborinia camelliae]|nr:hypothetical protein NHQ30_009087 [Ciborinia camelliae]
MLSTRTASRAAARTLRAPIRQRTRQTRFVSTTQAEGAKAGGASGFAAGVAGGAVVLVGCYTYYHFSGAKSVVNAYSATKAQFQNATSTLSEKAPEPHHAIKWLRNATSSYAAFIPGAQSFLDGAFHDIEKVQAKHGEEVDAIVQNTYEELKDIGENGAWDVQTAVKSYHVLMRALDDIARLGKDGLAEILEAHPQIREKVGGNLARLKRMTENYGPDAKREWDETCTQVSEILAGGLGAGAVEKVATLIQEKSERVKALGNEAWEQGMRDWKPFLEKHPEIREVVEGNKDVLKEGNVKEVFGRVRRAVEGGNWEDLREYVQDASEKSQNEKSNNEKSQNAPPKNDTSDLAHSAAQAAKKTGLPGFGSEKAWQKLHDLQGLAREHGGELEGLVRSAWVDVEKVVEGKVAEAEKLVGGIMGEGEGKGERESEGKEERERKK